MVAGISGQGYIGIQNYKEITAISAILKLI